MDEVIVSIWDPKSPWASIAHALQYRDGLPRLVIVPRPPAPSFSVDGLTVTIRQADDVLGVACVGHRVVDRDVKESCLARMRRGGQ